MVVRQHKKFFHRSKAAVCISALLMASSSVFAQTAQAAQSSTPIFTDVTPDYWGYSVITDLAVKGVVQGSNGSFNPEQNISRAEFATMLVNSLHLPLVNPSTPDFQDVQPGGWEYKAVETAYQAGIIHGVAPGQFDSTSNITREDMVVMLINSLHLQNMLPQAAQSVPTFLDAGQIETYAQQAVKLASALGLVTGNPGPTFDPLLSAKRVEAGVIIDRMLNLTTSKVQSVSPDAFQPIQHFAFHVTPSPYVQTGHQVQVQLTLVDASNHPVTLSQPMTVNLSLSNAQLGTLAQTTVTVPTSGNVTTTFQAGNQPGETQISASATTGSSSTLTGQATLTVYNNAAQLVSGKGQWLLWSDWHNNNTDQLIAKAKADGITHLYLETASSYQNTGFYGASSLEDLLHKAHDAHITVIDWVYATLANPTYDVQLAEQSARYKTATGDQVDALAPDIEEAANITYDHVEQYAGTLRSGLGSNYPLILVTYPPQWFPNLPWQEFGMYFDVICPMDYWHNYARPYTYNDAYSFVAESIQKIHSATGNPNIPITVAGEAYDMFTDSMGSNSPTPAEIQGSIDASKAGGAIGYSLYRWGTMTQAEWQAFAGIHW